MLNKDKLDLSIPAVQTMLVLTFNEYFTLEELEKIDIAKISCPADDQATKPCNGMSYDIQFENSSFAITCVLNTDNRPPVHYTKLDFDKSGYHTTFECNPNDTNPYWMMVTIAKAINFNKYRSKNDINYNRQSLLNNVAKEMAKIVPDFNVLIYFRRRVTEDLYMNDYYKDLSKPFRLEKDGYKYDIIKQYHKLLKVELSNKDKMDYAYFPKTDLGLNIALLVLDKAIVILKENKVKRGIRKEEENS